MDVLSFSSTDDATRAEVVQLRLGKYMHLYATVLDEAECIICIGLPNISVILDGLVVASNIL